MLWIMIITTDDRIYVKTMFLIYIQKDIKICDNRSVHSWNIH